MAGSSVVVIAVVIAASIAGIVAGRRAARREAALERQERSRLFWLAREWQQGDPL